MQGLKDIKPLMTVPDNSLFILISLIVGVLVIVLGLYFWLKKPTRKRRRRLSKREQAAENLKALDFSDTKEAVYDFSENMHVLTDENENEAFHRLLDKLEVYKYKKEVPALSESDKQEMIKMIKEHSNVT